LPREVRNFDPRLALDGGIDGLDAYRRIMPDALRLLSGGGWLIIEIGLGRAVDVLAIAQACGFADTSTVMDLAGHDRVVVARRPA
jgi:release factor glutamine methyltransferase